MFLIAAALAVPLAVYVFIQTSVHLRVAILLTVILSGSLSIVGVPGLLGVLVIIFSLRDARLILRMWTPGKLWWFLATMGLLVAFEPSGYSVSVGAGIALAVYVSTAVRAGGLQAVAWGGFVGSVVFAVRNLSAPVITVTDRIDGEASMIGRRILPNLDPNATAAILLVGMIFGFVILMQVRGIATLIVVLGLAVMATSIVLVAARYAMFVAAIGLVLGWFSSSSVARKALFGVVALVGAALLLPIVGETQSFARFANLSNDANSRTAIYMRWWNLVYENGFWIGLPQDIIYAQPTAPHNAFLEALAHFGIIGLIALIGCAWLLIFPFSNGGWQIRVPALGVLGLAMIVGLLGQYTPWLALVLLNVHHFYKHFSGGGSRVDGEAPISELDRLPPMGRS